MKLRHSLAASAALLPVAMLSTPAFAQSTGSVDFQNEIIVTGSANKGVAGFQSPDTSKAKSVLGQEVIERANPGQTILDTINLVPGVTFTNNDAYGSAGGQLSIRGFSSDRISLTMDGVPLNDSGGYSIYSNQQMDPELIEQVNVNLGSTDVDSPTAAATGSTVNYRTRLPNEEFGVHVSGSAGEFNFMRIFGAVDTGVFTGIGTRAFVSASTTSNDNPFNNYGRVKKSQFNARLYQPIGADGDFVSIAGHYNENRNNFFGSVPLRTDLKRLVGGVEVDRNVGSGSNDRFPLHNGEREYDINWPCSTEVAATPGATDKASSCGTEFDRRFNPSNTGNIRGSSRFTLNDSLVLTVDPSYQYVKANGGGTVTAMEGMKDGMTGYIGGRPYFGMDLNGDGDMLDEVSMLAPSQTRTDRYGVIANLRWNINDNHTLRLGYTWDSARHRQTGEVGLLQANGTPFDVFPMNDPQVDASGHVLQKRDRLSYAILHQVSGEYRGEFLDGALVANVGIRAPFMKRNLNNYCFTTSVSGFVDCFAQDAERNDAYAEANPNVQGPQKRVKKYDDILPNLGLVYKIDQNTSVFANYSKGLQVPGTDNLYNAFYYADNTAGANPRPEMTDNFDLGARYRSSKIQAQASVWYTRYQDRLASAYDPELDRNVYRNLGRVDKYGIDGSISYQPIPELALYAFGSYMKSDIKDNVLIDVDSNGNNVYELTAGKREGGAPAYTFGGSARALLGHVDLGVTAKRTGGRYLYDNNMPFVDGAGNVAYGAKTNAYWLVNLDARVNLEFLGLNDKTFFQLNVYNLFDALYVGNYNSSLAPTADKALNAQIGAPRTISGTISVQF
ncbi:TonB-dependent receptor [Sphingopyxis yananensis]|uniref:TonB-dependent receptor n=1 Tax=Sphingopyxis yananensis TaxID=2886687 RepID=UPI001D12688C|nr:TonB-dependent receptor [Sphingopyxis yananensis]MCC2602906.1 TonB-dependent receptor [Sphingopyxis yananensis]